MTHKEKCHIQEIFDASDENEKASYVFGLFPVRLMELDLTPQENAELIRLAKEEEND